MRGALQVSSCVETNRDRKRWLPGLFSAQCLKRSAKYQSSPTLTCRLWSGMVPDGEELRLE